MSWHTQYLATGRFKPYPGWYAVAEDDRSFIGPYNGDNGLEHAQHVARSIMAEGGDTDALHGDYD